MITQVFPDVKVYIMGNDGATVSPLLPLEPMSVTEVAEGGREE